MAMVFAREMGDELAGLVNELDKVVAANEEKKMASLVNILGDDAEKAEEEAAKFAEKNKVIKSAVVVPSDSKDGPGRYGIAADAAVTVMLYRGKKVEAVHVFAKGELSSDGIAAVVSDTKKILTDEEPKKRKEKKNKEKNKKDRAKAAK